MSDPVDFDAKRKAKQKKPRCEICGGDQHDFIGQCKRIAAITSEPEGGETYHLYPINDDPPPPDAA